jgi:hypothetical protein
MAFETAAKPHVVGFRVLTRGFLSVNFTIQFLIKNQTAMRTHYEISSQETGTVIIRCRKISKALRRWLRERDVEFNHRFFLA